MHNIEKDGIEKAQLKQGKHQIKAMYFSQSFLCSFSIAVVTAVKRTF